MANARSKTRARFSKTEGAAVSRIPVWSNAPSFSLPDTNPTTSNVSVFANSDPITLGWVSPGSQPSWITLVNGAQPRISFSGQPAATTLSNVVLSARVGTGTPVNSSPGTISVAGASTWTVGTISFTQGTSGTFDVAATGPRSLGYLPGGLYAVNSGSYLTGIGPLTEAGMLPYDGIGPANTTSMSFSYVEPDALPTLTLHPTQTGTLPYEATVYAAEGIVPSGYFLVSPDDSNLRSSTLSTWPDGSARVLVVASSGLAVSNGVTKSVNLRLNKLTDSAGTALTTADIANKFTSGITVDFSGSPQTLNTWGSPDVIWWANSQVICARYRLSCGLGVMEAVIDIHAFASPSSRALVEITIENGKLNPTTPVKPATQVYNSHIIVNGSTVKTLNTGDITRPINQLSGPVTITNITKANPAVFTYNNVAQADWIVKDWFPYVGTLNVPTGMTQLNGKFIRIVNASISPTYSGPNFQCEILDRSTGTWSAIDSTAYPDFTSATIDPIGAPAYGMVGHEAFRSWFCDTWIGGDPGTEITHNAAYLQKLPCFDKYSAAPTKNYATWVPRGYFDGVAAQPFGSDSYMPWSIGRHSTLMGYTGDHTAIGPLTYWDSHYIMSGDKNVRRAVIASALCYGSMAINYRSTATDMVVSHSECYGKSVEGLGWPRTGSNFGRYVEYGSVEVNHEPAVGLVAFLCRPSPCLIEIAQKQAHMNAVAQSSGTQIFGYYFGNRGKAWCYRNLAHAIWLTPTTASGTKAASVTAWRTSAITNLGANTIFFREWDLSPEDKLNLMWDGGFTNYGPNEALFFDNNDGGLPGFETAVWFHHFMVPELHKTFNMKLMTGTDQTNLGLVADWAALQPVRWVNEQPNGSWRYIGYRTTTGATKGSNNLGMGQPDTWAQARAIVNPNTPPTVAGVWYVTGGNEPATWTEWGQYTFVPAGGGQAPYMYHPPFWGALCSAVERGVPGADAAWTTVMSPSTGVTNISTFMSDAADDPRHRFYPRNK